MGGAGDPLLALYANAEKGMYLDPRNLPTLFQDVGGTIPVLAHGDPIRRANDVSGNGNHMTFSAGLTLGIDVDGKYCFVTNGEATGTVALNLSTTDKVSVFVSYMILGGSVTSLFESSTNSVSQPGSYGLLLKNVGKTSTVISGSSSYEYKDHTGIADGLPAMLSLQYDLAGATSDTREMVRQNGVVPSLTTSGATPGARNFANTTFYLFSRAGSILFFVGQMYGIAIRAGLTAAPLELSVEAALWSRTGTRVVAPPGLRTAAIGDSTIAAYAGGTAVLFLMAGVSPITIARPGNTIAQQRAEWVATYSVTKLAQKAVFVQVGLNDVAASGTAATRIAALQSFINLIRSEVSLTCKIYVSKMTPCRQRWIDVYGAVNGPIAQSMWADMNDAIAGTGPTPITGVDGRITSHVPLMDDGSGNLAAAYDTGDHIHPNTAGRQINADAWRAQLVADGLL